MPKKHIGVSRARLKRLLANNIDAARRYVNFTEGILKLIKRTVIIESDSSVSVAGTIEIKSLNNPKRDPLIALIIEPNATVSISS